MPASPVTAHEMFREMKQGDVNFFQAIETEHGSRAGQCRGTERAAESTPYLNGGGYRLTAAASSAGSRLTANTRQGRLRREPVFSRVSARFTLTAAPRARTHQSPASAGIRSFTRAHRDTVIGSSSLAQLASNSVSLGGEAPAMACTAALRASDQFGM